MLPFLILWPLVGAAAVFILNENRSRSFVLFGVSLIHLGHVMSLWRYPSAPFLGFLALDPLSLLVLSIVSVLFCVVSFYFIGYLSDEKTGSSRVFVGCLLLFLSSMTLVTLSQHLGLFWVGIEATALFSAPLISFHRSPQSIEATWKYLFICSIGISLALLGTLFLAVSASQVKTLFLSDLLSQASLLSVSWLKLAVIFLLVGYGTKMGLAPMHSWKPDSYAQAPGPVAALLSGGVASCAFLGILRVSQICLKANQTEFLSSILLVLGMLSLALAAIFILGQGDFNRMLAYTSIEHMGILVLGLGLGGVGIYGSMFHLVNNVFAEGMIFLTAGNIYRRYQTRRVSEVSGLLHRYPSTGILLVLGFMATVGIPPFATFHSELMILNAALRSQRYGIAFFYLFFLAIIFIGVAANILKMTQGLPAEEMKKNSGHERLTWILGPLFLGLMVFWFGIWMPDFLDQALQKAATALGG